MSTQDHTTERNQSLEGDIERLGKASYHSQINDRQVLYETAGQHLISVLNEGQQEVVAKLTSLRNKIDNMIGDLNSMYFFAKTQVETAARVGAYATMFHSDAEKHFTKLTEGIRVTENRGVAAMERVSEANALKTDPST